MLFAPLPGIAAQDYRQSMRTFVIRISAYAKAKNSDFAVIPQNGQELMVHETGDEDEPATEYINALDGAGQENLFFGYRADNRPTPKKETDYLIRFLDTAKKYGTTILVTDYCSTPKKMGGSYAKNRKKGYVSFAAPERELDIIPDYPDPVPGANSRDMKRLSDIRNFLYLINPSRWDSKKAYLEALWKTDYDLLIIDSFLEDAAGNPVMLTPGDVELLKTKKNGGRRMVVSYMSIGEAEDYRYYWQEGWIKNPPAWLAEENRRWPGNYKVRYWDRAWQAVILGSPNAYLDKILAAGFDGVYLDIIDAFEYFEESGH